MKRVYICSTYTGDRSVTSNIARILCRKASAVGLAPFSPILLHAGLDEESTSSPLAALSLGLSFLPTCSVVWAYMGAGVTIGMNRELRLARELGKPVYGFLNLDEPAPTPWPPKPDEWPTLNLDNILWAVKEIDSLLGGSLLPNDWWTQARFDCSDMLMEHGLGQILSVLTKLSEQGVLPDLPEGWANKLTSFLNDHDNRLILQNVNPEVSESICTDEWHKVARLFIEFGGDFERALMFLEKSLQDNPQNHLAWQDKGYCLWMLGQPEEASEAYRVSVDLVEGNAKAWQGLGQALAAQKFYREAREAFDEGLKHANGDVPDLAGLRQDAFDLEQGAIHD
jgi:hypothetical protein